MARRGTIVRTRDGRYQPVIVVAGVDGKPTRRRLRALPEGTTEARAREVAAREQARADREGWVRPRPTRKRTAPAQQRASEAEAEAWWRAFVEDRAKRLTGRDKAASHYRTHLATLLAHHPRDWTADDMRAVVLALDGKVTEGKMSPKTARNVWATVQAACDAAASSKVDALRCRPDRPDRLVKPPEKGTEVQKQFLYPEEVATFLACDALPVGYRRLVALACYLYMRPGELAVLRWQDVDLERGVVHIRRAHDHKAGSGAKATKTGAVRSVGLEPAVVPLLAAMKAEAAGPLVVGDGLLDDLDHLAKPFRDALLAAGVDRAELHHADRGSKPMVFYGCRHTGITWRAVRGDSPVHIMADAGHRSFSTTQGYIRTAAAFLGREAAFGAPFPPVPRCLLGDHASDHPTENPVVSCEGGDSNPHSQSGH